MENAFLMFSICFLKIITLENVAVILGDNAKAEVLENNGKQCSVTLFEDVKFEERLDFSLAYDEETLQIFVCGGRKSGNFN